MSAYSWKRSTECFGSKSVDVFIDGIMPSDINQGALGNCYFLAVLSALAESPDRVKKCFYT